MLNLYELTRPDLAEALADRGIPHGHAPDVWREMYARRVESPDVMESLSTEQRARLAASTRLGGLAMEREAQSADGTRKWLFRLPDGEMVETVLMRHRGRATACISTQAGCAMGCVFCATGQMGFVRNLTAGEIVEQVVRAAREADRDGVGPLRNVVLMGMGEPLHNYDATLKALGILLDQRGLSLAPRFVTLSTVGLVPAIRRLADDGVPVRLAVSLHAATDDERSALLPVNRRWPLAELMNACRYYNARTGKRVMFEWAVIEGRNDFPEQAHALTRLLTGLDAQVNLIPLNSTADYSGRPGSRESIEAFRAILRHAGIPSSIRIRRGIEIDAGCGQLRARQTAKP